MSILLRFSILLSLQNLGNIVISAYMEIKPHRLAEFKKLYKQEFGIELTDQEILEKASLLLDYVRLCMKPMDIITVDD
jgi:hypothetical protein